MNSSQEFLNLARAGDTAGGVQSSGNGSTCGATLFVVRRLAVDILLGRLDSMIRCISFLLTSASSKIRATREKYTAGRRRRRQRYNWRGSVSENKPWSSKTGVMGIQHVSGRSDCSSVLLGEQILKCHLNGSIGMNGSSREWVRWRAHCCKNRSGEAAREADRLGVSEPGVSLRGLAGLLSPTGFTGLWFRGVFPVHFSGLRLRGVLPEFPKACKGGG